MVRYWEFSFFLSRPWALLACTRTDSNENLVEGSAVFLAPITIEAVADFECRRFAPCRWLSLRQS